jgi:repressor LexA
MTSLPDCLECVCAPQYRTSQTAADFVQCDQCSPTLCEISGIGQARASYELASVQGYGYLPDNAERLGRAETRLLTHPVIRLESQDLEGPGLMDAQGTPSRDTAYAIVPVMGQIRAGDLNAAERVPEDTFLLPKQIVGEGRLFMLKVVGDSMINAAIADGAWVVVRQQPKAENGEVVAAMIDGEATVKTLQHADGHVWLMPRNPDYTPILGDAATILGKVVAVVRQI